MSESRGRGRAGRAQETVKTGDGYELAEWFNKNIDFLTDKTNEELATALGYSRPNIISMWRTGRAKIPLDKLESLASELDIELTFLLPMWMEQYGTQRLKIETVKAFRTSTTPSEEKLIKVVREITEGRAFKLKAGAKSKLQDIISLK